MSADVEKQRRDARRQFEDWCRRSYNPSDRSPPFIGDAMWSVADTLHGAWLLAVAEFGERAQPEHAVMLLSAIEPERARIASGWQERIQAERTK